MHFTGSFAFSSEKRESSSRETQAMGYPNEQAGLWILAREGGVTACCLEADTPFTAELEGYWLGCSICP